MKVNGRKYTTATKQVNINGKTSNKRQQMQQQAGNEADKRLKMELRNAQNGREERKNEEEAQKRREKIKEKRALEKTKIRTQRKKTNPVKKKRDARKEKERLTGIKRNM